MKYRNIYLCVFLTFSLLKVNSQTHQELLNYAATFKEMPSNAMELFLHIGTPPTSSSGAPYNDLEFTVFDTDYMDGETNGRDVFMPVDPSDEFPGADKVKFIKGTINIDLNANYGGPAGDRIILGTEELPVFFQKGKDNIDNDFCVIQNIDYNHGHIQLKGNANDYRLEYFTLNEGVKTEGYFLFYAKDNTLDLIAFIFPCWDIGATISGRPPQNPLALCNGDSALSLYNTDHFKFAQPISTATSVPEGIIQYGTNGKEVIGGFTTDKDGNSYLMGLTDGNLDNNTDAENEIFIAKISPFGEELWVSEMALPEGSLLMDATTDDNYVFVCGRTLGALPGYTNAGKWDGIILKLDINDGNIVASNQWGNKGIDGYGNIVLDDNGNLFVSAQGSPQSSSTMSGGTDKVFLVAKHKQSDLSNVWRIMEEPSPRVLASAEAWGGLSYKRDTTPGDGTLVAGGWYFAANGANGFLVSYEDLNNNTPTRKNETDIISDGTKADWIIDNIIDQDGSIYAVGYTTGDLEGTHKGEGDAYIVKFDQNLSNPLFKQIGTNKNDQFHKIKMDNDGYLYVSGYTYGDYSGNNADINHESGDMLILKFDKNLNEVASTQFGTPHEERGFISIHDSILYVGGMTEGNLCSTSHGSFDGFVLALNTEDLTVVANLTAIPDFSNSPPKIKIAPNPASNKISIDVGQKISSCSTISLYNSIGQLVIIQALSSNITNLDISYLEKGIYILKIETENKTVFTKKIIKH